MARFYFRFEKNKRLQKIFWACREIKNNEGFIESGKIIPKKMAELCF